MPLERDAEGYAVVRVSDLVEYLSRFPPETTVHLDKDGWMEDELHADNAVELVKQRGLFHSYGKSLIINN